MLLAELVKSYAGSNKSDKALLSYLETEHEVVRFDPGVNVADVTEEWIGKFEKFAGAKHARNVRKAVKNF